MTIYIRRNGKFVDKFTGSPMLPDDWKDQPVAMPRIVPDIPPYRSPLGNYVVDGRAARREDLKRNNCREVDPSEFTPEFSTDDMARRYERPKGR